MIMGVKNKAVFKAVFTAILLLLFLSLPVYSQEIENSVFVRVDQEPEGRNTFHLLHFVTSDKVVGGFSVFNYNDGGDVFFADDGGVNFEKVDEYVAPLRGRFSFPDSQTGYVTGSRVGFGTSMYVGKTTDGGETWTDLTANMVPDFISRTQPVQNVAAPSANTIFVVTGRAGTVHPKSTMYGPYQGGAEGSWFIVNDDNDYYTWTLNVIDDRTYIATYTGFEYLNTGSEQWTVLQAPWDHENDLELKNIYYTTVSRGWALVENTASGLLTLYETTNGAEEWQAISSSDKNDNSTLFPRLGNLIFHDQKLFGTARVSVEGRSRDYTYVLISSDGGRTWTRDDWHDSRASGWPLRLVDAAGELRVYSYISGINIRHYGKYSPSPSDQYVINLTANPAAGGTVTGWGNYSEGSTATVEAISSQGYQFVSWTEAGTVVSTNPIYEFVVDSNRTLIANFEEIGSGLSAPRFIFYENAADDLVRADFQQAEDDLFKPVPDSRLLNAIVSKLINAFLSEKAIYVEAESGRVIDYAGASAEGLTFSEAYNNPDYWADSQNPNKELIINSQSGEAEKRLIIPDYQPISFDF